MSKKKVASRCLVVDASVAKAAGSLESKHPTGVLCREFLMAARSVCHHVAWSDAIRAEWERHESTFARQWRLSMFNLRKLRSVRPSPSSTLRDSIQERCGEKAILSIVLDDCHLLDAAFATDFRVASLDEQVRGHLAALARAVEALQRIIWVNPAIRSEHAVEWLEKGAPDKKNRRLLEGRR